MSLTVVGGVARDLIERPPNQLGPRLGGSATYAAMAAAPLADVRIVSVIGDDLSSGTLDPVRKVGVDVSEVEVRPGRTAMWWGAYGARLDARRTMATSRGVTEGYLPELSPGARGSRAVLLGAGNPAAQLHARGQLASDTLVGVDTIDHWIDDDRAGVELVLAAADVIFIGDTEAKQLTGHTRASAVAAALELRRSQVLVVKGGGQGSWLLYDGQVDHVAAYRAQRVIDPTGAGDAYAGAFMASMAASRQPLSRRRLWAAALAGAAAGSIAVEGQGVSPLVQVDSDAIAARVKALAGAPAALNERQPQREPGTRRIPPG